MSVYSVHGIIRYADEKIVTKSGLYFENQGPLKIMTTQWNLVAFYDLTDSHKRIERFNEYIHATDKICTRIKELNITLTNCDSISELIKLLKQEGETKRDIIFESIGHSRTKRGFPLRTITKVAQTLFDLCDYYCVLQSNSNIKTLTD